MILLYMYITYKRKKGRDLTQSYDKSPNTHSKIQKVKAPSDYSVWALRTGNVLQYLPYGQLSRRMNSIGLNERPLNVFIAFA